ncbi:MAG TPA: DUF4126 domain-containing protein [Ktedonobacterales bacterium]
MPILGTCEPVQIATAIAALLTALGLSAASGLRAYLPVAAIFIGSVLPDGCSQQGDLISLSTSFKHLFGQNTPWLLVGILALLAAGEFIVDKVPVIDHASDLVHTIIRPLAGAAVMAGVSNPLSEWNPWVAAITGAALALTVHGTKAATRAASTATTAGLGNPVVSFAEDILAVLMVVLSLLAPFLAILFFALLALLFIRAASRTVGWIRGRDQTQGQAPAVAGSGAPPPASSATYYGAPPDGPGGSSPTWPGE